MDGIMEFIEKIGTRNLIFAGVGLVVLIILFLFYRGMRLRKYRKLIVDIENRMNAIKSLPLQYRLGRVQSISKNMPDIVEQYEEYAAEFEKISDFQKNELAVLVNEVDDSFVQLEGMMNNQRFEDAKNFTGEIEERVDWLNQRLEDLPSYIAVVRQYIPKKINHIDTLIEEMSKESFSLNQLEVDSRYDSIKKTLEECVVHIKHLELDDMGTILQGEADAIDRLIHDLEVEQQAYHEFKEKWDACYSLITEIYDQYKQALIDSNRINSLYVINEEHIEIDERFQEFDKILRESYDLEEEMNKGDFAYSQMIAKVELLKDRASVHQDDLNTFFAFRDHLYLQEQRAIDELENINIVLLEIKSEIKNKHLPMINESYKDYIQDSYDKAAQIQAYRMNRPVELSELSKRVDGARDVIYKLYDNVHNLIVTAEMVEEAIVFGNRYRSTFLEVNTELTKAEVLFRNGEYTKALSTAVDIIEKIQPGSYETLIKKSTEKSE